jgi:ribulose-phosphate 3-epimerase
VAVICPTVTALDPHEYREQMERIEPFAERVHIDLMDGELAPTKSPGLDHVWWPENLKADIHLMYQKPMDQLEQLVKLKPNLVVIHYEAEVDHAHFATHLRENGIKAGLAILQDTPAEKTFEILNCFDHVLIFSGNLGHHGGEANLDLLGKIPFLRQQKPDLEISWDGGINDQNAKRLIEGGVDVLNVGGFIQNSDDPTTAYAKLKA